MSEHRHHPMTEAARNLDAIAEEHGLERTVEDLDLDLKAVLYVAKQRALRLTVLTHRGAEALKQLNTGTTQAVSLSVIEQSMVMDYTLALLDGLVIGWKAREISENDKEHNA